MDENSGRMNQFGLHYSNLKMDEWIKLKIDNPIRRTHEWIKLEVHNSNYTNGWINQTKVTQFQLKWYTWANVWKMVLEDLKI